MSLADNIRRLREQRKFSQSELARMVGVSQQAIDRYEKGKMRPDIFTGVSLAKSLETTVEKLVEG